MSLIAAVILLAQVGPFTPPGGGDASPLPPELRDRKPRREAQATPAAVPAAPKTDCTKPDGSAMAALCLGIAESDQGHWDKAEAAFMEGRQAATGPLRARLGAMAGNAALAQAAPARALNLLDTARADLGADRAGSLPIDIALDRARALVALQRLPEAEAALAEARELAPGDAEAWLLSATLSRRSNRLDEAQARIEKAGQLRPTDPEIGLEAGVIAVLAGRDEAARRSWRSVLAIAPQSPAAETAKAYLAQLPPAPPATESPSR